LARTLVCPNFRLPKTGRRTGRLGFEIEPAGPPADSHFPDIWAHTPAHPFPFPHNRPTAEKCAMMAGLAYQVWKIEDLLTLIDWCAVELSMTPAGRH
jgi:hypothetical protein